MTTAPSGRLLSERLRTYLLTLFVVLFCCWWRRWRVYGRNIDSGMVWRMRSHLITYSPVLSWCWTATTSLWRWIDFPEKMRSVYCLFMDAMSISTVQLLLERPPFITFSHTSHLFCIVGWVIWPVNIIPEMTYKVSIGASTFSYRKKISIMPVPIVINFHQFSRIYQSIQCISILWDKCKLGRNLPCFCKNSMNISQHVTLCICRLHFVVGQGMISSYAFNRM